MLVHSEIVYQHNDHMYQYIDHNTLDPQEATQEFVVP